MKFSVRIEFFDSKGKELTWYQFGSGIATLQEVAKWLSDTWKKYTEANNVS